MVDKAQALQPNSPEVKQAQTLLKTGQLLPKPIRGKGGTGPIGMAQVKLHELLGHPLEHGIEPGFVHTLIERNALPAPAEAGLAWPFRLRVRVLGGFELIRDGRPRIGQTLDGIASIRPNLAVIETVRSGGVHVLGLHEAGCVGPSLGVTSKGVGLVYNSQEDFPKALEYLIKGNEIDEELTFICRLKTEELQSILFYMRINEELNG